MTPEATLCSAVAQKFPCLHGTVPIQTGPYHLLRPKQPSWSRYQRKGTESLLSWYHIAHMVTPCRGFCTPQATWDSQNLHIWVSAIMDDFHDRLPKKARLGSSPRMKKTAHVVGEVHPGRGA